MISGVEGWKVPESQERTRHHGVEEELVKTHVGFFGAYSTYELEGLLGREGIHLKWLQRSLGDRRISSGGREEWT
jgi:hypothetical protein